MEVKNSFKPIIDKKSKILILGSLPSDKSLAVYEYYGNKLNHFWKILIAIFAGNENDIKTYENKKQFLHRNRIALWDVYKKAIRKGSEDKNIMNTEFNDIESLLNTYPNIELILLNGKKSYLGFEKYIKDRNISSKYKYVPSSSSLNATYKFDKKVEYWRKVLEEVM